MKRDEFKSIIKEVYTELLNEFPTLKFDVYRDGDSVSISNQNDELGFIVWDEEIHTTVYIMREFKQRDIGIMTHLFYYLVSMKEGI